MTFPTLSGIISSSTEVKVELEVYIEGRRRGGTG
jgi:hypothetical protein